VGRDVGGRRTWIQASEVVLTAGDDGGEGK
jgi:hypothetical protein